MLTKNNLIKLSDYLFEIPKSFREDMRVPARIYISEKMLDDVFRDKSLEQLVNIATLPGIVEYALAMPDIHEGYGFPIGGIAAINLSEGAISPGGVGYDINCGVRVLTSEISYDEIKPHLNNLINEIFRQVPSGLGKGGGIKLGKKAMDNVLEKGVPEIIEKGFGAPEDIEVCEEKGSMKGAKSDYVSNRAKERGRDQLGTLGAGNHFLEIQKVDKIFNEEIAKIFGLFENQITIMIHCGSRGLGHQVCDDYVKIMQKNLEKYKIKIPDRELACAPINSPEGKKYFGAMSSAANFAWANRQVITYLVRKSWEKILGESSKNLDLLYDVAHNIAKIEIHDPFPSSPLTEGKNPLLTPPLLGGRKKGVELELCVQRKGATRAFGPGRKEIPKKYRRIGQPVIIPGSMGTSSYILLGTEEAMKKTFGTVCHGAGRIISRKKAKKQISGSNLRKKLEKQGLIIRCKSDFGLAEEAPEVYKDIDNVVEVVHQVNLAKKVARLKPLGVIKG